MKLKSDNKRKDTVQVEKPVAPSLEVEAPKKRGPKPTVCGKRFNFHFSDTLREEVDKLAKRGEACNIVYTYAFALREGVKLFLARENAKLDKMERGALHAKKRKQ